MHAHRRDEFGLTRERLDTILGGMEKLRRRTVLFPDPWELLAAGDKCLLAENLDKVAATLTYARPAVARIAPDSDEKTWGKNVLKRGYSAYGECVFFPESPQYPRNWASLVAACPGHDAYWLAQPPVPSLREHSVGEFRCYFVGRKLIRILRTRPTLEGDLDVEEVRKMYPLREWR